MKPFLNVLYVTLQGAYLSKDGDTVEIHHDQEVKLKVPFHMLQGIVCFGNVSCSPFLMGACGENNITLSFLTENGRFLARVYGPVRGNVLLRKEQYRRSDNPDASVAIARSAILAKLANSRVVLQRALRDHPEIEGRQSVERSVKNIGRYMESLKEPGDLDKLRGIEGMAANSYFDSFDHLIVANKEKFYFRDRNRRPPLDNVNSLLSLLYTLLMHDVQSALEAVGLDPAVGFLHRDRPGRPSLALDMMEELRAYLVDRLVLSLINRQQISAEGFIKTESGAVLMDDDTRKTVLVAWQKRKQEEITHPFIGEKISLGLIAHVQAMLMARHLRGDIEGYPPFFWR